MKGGYNIKWTNHALRELNETFDYLEKEWTEKELKNLAQKIEKITRLISLNPNVFPDSTIKKGVKRAVLDKFNTIYYRLNGETVEILSFFANRKNPDTLNLDN